MRRQSNSAVQAKAVLCLLLPLAAQSGEVVGKVLSSEGGRGLEGAIVRVVSAVQPGTVLPKRQPPKLEIRDGQLDPQVLVVLTGETFILTNADGEAYNVQLRFREHNEMALAVGAERPTTIVKAGPPELFARVAEDLNRLHGYVCVVENPFYAITDTNGTFRISGLPPGAYTIEATHPREGRINREVIVGDRSTIVDFNLPWRAKAKPR